MATTKEVINELLNIRAIWDQRRFTGSRTPTQAGELMSQELSRVIDSLRAQESPQDDPLEEERIELAARAFMAAYHGSDIWDELSDIEGSTPKANAMNGIRAALQVAQRPGHDTGSLT